MAQSADQLINPSREYTYVAFYCGTRRLFDWIHSNTLVEMHPADYVNDRFVIAQHKRMVAINSAL